MEMEKMIRGAEIFVVFVCMFAGENGVKLNFNFEIPRGVFRWAYETGIRGQKELWGPPGCQSLTG